MSASYDLKRESQVASAYTTISFLWTIVVFVALVMPVETTLHKDVLALPFIDKLVHVALFGILYLLWIQSAIKKKWRLSGTTILVCVIIYGVFCEGIQFYLKDRSFDILDIIANIMGSLVAYLIYKRN